MIQNKESDEERWSKVPAKARGSMCATGEDGGVKGEVNCAALMWVFHRQTSTNTV